jgi:hypothetical protein
VAPEDVGDVVGLVVSVWRDAAADRGMRPSASQRGSSRAGLPELYASWNPTDADLFLWVYKLRRDLRGQDAAIDFDAAAAHARGVKQHERSRRQVLREGSRPLPRRPPRQGSS